MLEKILAAFALLPFVGFFGKFKSPLKIFDIFGLKIAGYGAKEILRHRKIDV